MKQLTKDQLLKRNEELESLNDSWKGSDFGKRSAISSFINDPFDRNRIMATTQKILDWPEIYFEIGKLVEKANKIDTIMAMEATIRGQSENLSRAYDEIRRNKEEKR